MFQSVAYCLQAGKHRIRLAAHVGNVRLEENCFSLTIAYFVVFVRVGYAIVVENVECVRSRLLVVGEKLVHEVAKQYDARAIWVKLLTHNFYIIGITFEAECCHDVLENGASNETCEYWRLMTAEG